MYRYVTSYVPVCHKLCTGMSQVMYRYVTSYVPVCHKLCTGMSTSMSQVMYRYVTSYVPVCHKLCTSMSQPIYLWCITCFAKAFNFLSPAGAVGPGQEILQRPPRLSVRPSVRPSVTFSFRTVTQKRIDVFSRNFAGMCTKSWGCAVLFLILMECCLNFV